MRPIQSVQWLGCFLVLTLFLGALGQNITNEEDLPKNGTKLGKVFSLFSIVTFKNTGCRSTSSLPSGQSTVRNGTCYASSECTAKGGIAYGNCAAGFGVCCVFIVSTSGGVVQQNCSYIQNPGYPSSYTGTSSVTYTIQKCNTEVCYLRLDFEAFNLLGPTDSVETSGGSCARDTFKVTTTTGQSTTSIPTICGLNTGQHIYVDMGNVATDTTTLTFAFTTTTTTRNWEIKVTQIECSNPSRPPNGCLQYFTTYTGRISTFNFLSTTTTHLASQDVTACIRRQEGYCCVQYQVCANVINAYTLSGQEAIAALDSKCLKDFVAIPGSSTSCSTTNTPLNNRYCGLFLSSTALATTINLPICDCTSPFMIHFHTDATQDTITSPARGTCLDYQLLPCASG